MSLINPTKAETLPVRAEARRRKQRLCQSRTRIRSTVARNKNKQKMQEGLLLPDMGAKDASHPFPRAEIA